MATAIRMLHPQTGIVKAGYFGFSWTSFFFGGIPALIRGDLWVGLAVIAASLGASAVSAGMFWFVVGLVWAFIYNKRYTHGLLQSGFVFDDDPRRIADAKRELGVV